jgi:hypothetical protein
MRTRLQMHRPIGIESDPAARRFLQARRDAFTR